MPVKLQAPNAEDLLPVAGVRIGTARAHIKKPDRRDMMLMALDTGTRVAGVFTKNQFCAAPVLLCREFLGSGQAIRGLVVNTGYANAGTGEPGLRDARAVCKAAAELLDCQIEQILPFSTGVIIEPLPVARVTAGLPACQASLDAKGWRDAADAIMTTDTVAKGRSAQAKLGDATITITGIAKGAGMIHPNMATMLGFVATDALVSQPLLNEAVRRIADRSFNRATVDGDTSTNDSFILIATGQADMPEIGDAADPRFAAFIEAVVTVAEPLAQAMVRDGEGASKFISIVVEQGKTVDDCCKVAFAIAHSPLVKTAFFASDPNLGRILAAAGNAGVAIDPSQVTLYLDDVLVARNGGRDPSYREEDGQRIMQQDEITIRLQLGQGDATTTVWTCDFSYDYVKINADYRS